MKHTPPFTQQRKRAQKIIRLLRMKKSDCVPPFCKTMPLFYLGCILCAIPKNTTHYAILFIYVLINTCVKNDLLLNVHQTLVNLSNFTIKKLVLCLLLVLCWFWLSLSLRK